MTSEQYKYLLVKRLQRDFSVLYTGYTATTPYKPVAGYGVAKRRFYAYTFFCELFKVPVSLTEENYNDFITNMDTCLEYCKTENIVNINSFTNENDPRLETVVSTMQPAFEAVGITMELGQYDSGGNNGDVIFTRPDGVVMTFEESYCWEVHTTSGVEYTYSENNSYFDKLLEDVVPEITDINPKKAGYGTFWSYDSVLQRMTITGAGSYAGVFKDTQIGSGTYTSVILGADVNELLKGCFETGQTIVLFRPSDATFKVNSDCIENGTESSHKTLTIYTDNLILKNLTFPQYVDVTWHSLDEWNG